MHYNPLAYIKNEADILKFVNALISNTKGEGKEGDPFWTKAETLLCAALNSLPETQGRRVDACAILGKSYREVAEAEGVNESSVRESVKLGLESMKKYLKKVL